MLRLRTIFATSLLAFWGYLPGLFAQDLSYEVAGGGQLTIKVKAEQQQWVVVGDKILVSAVCDGKLVVKEFSWPGPTPGPLPPDPQPLPSKLQVAFIVESDTLDNLPASQQALLASVLIRDEMAKQGHKLIGVFDPDSASTAGDALKPWLDAAKDKKLPLVAVAPIDGGTIHTFPLPENAEALWKLLKNPQAQDSDEKKPDKGKTGQIRLLCPGGVCR